MKEAIVAFALAAASVLVEGPAAAQDMPTTDLGSGIFMLEGSGGNIGVSTGEDGVFMVDDQYAVMTPRILAAVGKISQQPIRFILNTHWHPDHVGGNENFAKAGVTIFAHENVRILMRTDQVLSAVSRTVPAAPVAALPVVTFTDDVTFHLNGETIRVFHVPAAHTDGDAIVHFVEAGVIHMGDVYINAPFPFIDTEHGGTVEGVIAAIDKVLGMVGPDTKIIPGHGPLSDKDGLREYREMMAERAVRLEKRMSNDTGSGKTTP